jgi:hypothetical protein
VKWILKEWGGVLWAGFLWLRIGISGMPLRAFVMAQRFVSNFEIFWQVERILASLLLGYILIVKLVQCSLSQNKLEDRFFNTVL